MKTTKDICKEIKCDIEKGVYQQWPKLKKELTYICNKLYKSTWVFNAPTLNRKELTILAENRYIEKHEITDYLI